MQNTKLVISFADVNNVNKCNIMGKFEDLYQKNDANNEFPCVGCVFDSDDGCQHPEAIDNRRFQEVADCEGSIWVKKQIEISQPEIASDIAKFEDLYKKESAIKKNFCTGCIFDVEDKCLHPNLKYDISADCDCDDGIWVKKQIETPQPQSIETPSNKEGQFLLLAQNGSTPPRFVHKDIDSAINEAHRLAVKTNGSVKILEVVGEVNRTVVLGVQLNSKFGIENYTKEVDPYEDLLF